MVYGGVEVVGVEQGVFVIRVRCTMGRFTRFSVYTGGRGGGMGCMVVVVIRGVGVRVVHRVWW